MASPLDTLALSYSPSYYWGMEDAVGSATCADLSGNGNTLTNSGMTLGEPSIVPSDPLTCAYLPAASSSNVASSTYKPSIASNVAVSVMSVVNLSVIPTAVSMMINNLSSSQGQQLKVTTSGLFAWDLGNGSTSVTKSSGATPVVGHDYLVVGTYSYTNTTMTVYVFDLTTATAYTPATASLAAGTFEPTSNWVVSQASGFPRYQGRTAFFQTALTSAQVTALFQAAVLSPAYPTTTLQAVSRAANW